MLSSSRILRSRLPSAALRATLINISRVPISQSLTRLQHTTRSNFEQVDGFDDKYDSERRAKFDEMRAREERKLAEISERAKNQLGRGESAASVLEYMTLELSQVHFKARSKFDTRITFAPVIDLLIDKAGEEMKSKDSLLTPVTYDEILQKLSEFNVVNVNNFQKVINTYYSEKKLQEVLLTWVSFLEYCTIEGIKGRALKTKVIVQLAYIEDCLEKGTKPDDETIKALLQTEELPHIGILRKTLGELFGKKGPRYDLMKKSLDKKELSNQNPNSIQFLQQVARDAHGGNARGVGMQYDQLKRISEASGIPLTEDSQVAFMNAFNRIFQARKAMEIWNEMMKAKVIPSTLGWNALLETVSKFGPHEGRLEQVETVFANIPQKNDESYAKLITIYAFLKQYEKIDKLVTDKLLEKPLVAQSYFQYLAGAGKIPEAQQTIVKMEKNGILLTRASYNGLIGAYIRANKFNEARKVLTKMEAQGLRPDVATYTMLIDLTFKDTRQKGDLVNDDLISSFLDNMRGGGIEPNVFTMTTIIDGLGKDPSHEETAMKLFQYLQEHNLVSNVTYGAMIASAFNFGRVRQAELYFADYIKAGYKPSISSWNQMFDGFARNKAAHRAKEYYLAFRKSVPDSFPDANKFTLYFLLKAARFGRDPELANLVLDDMVTHNLTRSTRVIESIRELSRLQGVKIPKSIDVLL